jgi:hypothetical protein
MPLTTVIAVRDTVTTDESDDALLFRTEADRREQLENKLS